ncbi:MAG: prepilin-type N-terminal cleavage/methylation domain-containing protein [Sulfurimonas sp.]|nr:prepilin-type N-terminal cleavage/methylation domain-containing protein [Sulfurimonas sp.]
MRKAFSLIELLITVALAGAMAIFTLNYYIDTSTISKENIKTELQSHFNILSAAILQCKELSNAMPINNNLTLANNTLIKQLDCNTSTPYALDGGKGYFMPVIINGFTDYKATQNGTEFYISTTAKINSNNDEVLQDLNSSYSTNQYVLTHDATTAYLNFYISR